MKGLLTILYIILLAMLQGCDTRSDHEKIIEEIRYNFYSGNITRSIYLADSLKKSCHDNPEGVKIADSLSQIADRIMLDFSVNEEQVKSEIEMKTGHYSDMDKSFWEENGWLEWRLIDGEKKYFKRAVSNLVLLNRFYEQKDEWLLDIANDPQMRFRLNHTEAVITSSGNKNIPVLPVKMKITYTLTVHPDVVPEGNKIRCWLPWPREDFPRQKMVKLLSTSNPNYIISPDTAMHNTIFMEERSQKGIPAVFTVSFSYQSSAQYFNMKNIKPLDYNKTSPDYKKYTSEQPPQLRFTENVKKLADLITDPDDNPIEIVDKIYLWFKDNIPWTGALEYSIIPDIPEYVYQNRRGDCGMQTFLFMSMLRYKGVPVRWQSGWMVPPGGANLHDWCEVYYEGTGWVPVDISYDIQNSQTPEVRNFYMSGIDAFRLIVNDGFEGPLHPVKKHLRSEPYDFQRGEVEWEGGNLYFNEWDYDIKIEYIN
jgi:hypothetical protein